jgi:cytochrome P450
MAEILDFPFEEGFSGDPSVRVAELRDERPVCPIRLPSGTQAWFVTRYADVQRVMSDPRFSRMVRHGNTRYAAGAENDEVDLTEEMILKSRSLSMDGPGHVQLRRLAGQAFTNKRVQGMRPQIQQVTDGLLDGMAAAGPPADLMASLAAPLPMQIICALLGLPEKDRAQFSEWSAALIGHHAITRYSGEDVTKVRQAMTEYLMGLIAVKRRQPQEDILTVLAHAEDNGDRLTDFEIVAVTRAMLVAGHITTVSMIGIGLWRLFRHPAQFEALKADLSLVSSAVEEILRYQPQGHFAFPQIATEDTEIRGVKIRSGELVFAPSYGANRDERQFPNAETFDIERKPNAHLSFGYGSHFCIGAPLARVELEIAYRSLLQRFRGLAPAIPLDQMRWRRGEVVGALEELPVTWEA